MAEYIADSGAYSIDAQFSGTYTKDANGHKVTFGADGKADTNFVFPTTKAWLLIETYNVNGVNGAIGGTWWQSDVSQVDTDLTAYRAINTALVTATTYTSFKMKATLYNGSNVAKIMEADNTTAFDTEASPAYTKTGWTPPTKWIISDTLIAPSDFTQYTFHMSFNRETPPQDTSSNPIAWPSGIYGNDWNRTSSYSTAEQSLIDENNNAISEKWKFTTSFPQESRASISATEIDYLSRHQLVNSWLSSTAKTMEVYLLAGTYTIKYSAASGQVETTRFTVDNDQFGTLEMTQPQPNGISINITITTARWVELDFTVESGSNCRVGGISITRTA